MKRQIEVLTALALSGLCVPAFSQAGSPFRDQQGRFSLAVPSGWSASPLGDAVQLRHGNALASVLVSEGRQDTRNLLLSLGGQMAGQWRNFKEIQTAASSLGGQPASYGVFGGLNPQGVDSLLKIVTSTNGRNSFAIIMSSPTAEFMANRPGFDAIELSFSMGNTPAAPAQAPVPSSAPAARPAPPAPSAPSVSAAALPDRPVPQGFTLTRDSQGSGRVLFGSFNGSARSATVTAQGILANLRGYFDDAPAIASAARDDRDSQVQALFTASIGGVPVNGVIGIELNGGGGIAAVIFDRAGFLGDSYLRLRGKSTASQLPLQRTSLADGSTIGLPQGWRVVASGKGTVDLAGPNNESISLGAAAPVYTQAPRLPGMPANYVLSGPCCDPVRAMAVLTPQFSAMMVKSGYPAIQFVRVLDAQPTQSPVNGGQAAFIFSDMTLGGRPTQQFSWVMAAPTGYGQWVYYISAVSAPTELFSSAAPTLLAIWKSYSTNPAVFAERIDNAIKSMNQATASVLAAGRESSRVREAAAEGWDQVIRGVETVKNTTTGRTYQVDNRAAQGLVDGLNGTGNGNWKVLTMDELVPKR
jgi:hypothetical protein